MTMAREPWSIEAALLQVLRELTPAEIEGATGRKPAYFYRLARPDTETSIGAGHAAALDALLIAGGRPPLLLPAIERARDHQVERLGGPRHQAQPPAERMMRLVATIGDVCAELAAAQADHSDGGRAITDAEAQQLAARIREGRAQLDRLEADIAAHRRPPRAVA